MKTDTKRAKFIHVLSLFLSVLGMILILLCTSKYGPGATPDSAAYMYAAESFRGGQGFLYFGYNSPLIQWPPLFSMIIAAVSTTGLDTMTAARYINAFIYALIIFFSGIWLNRHVKRPQLVLLGMLAILMSVPLLHVARIVWSEALFILLVVLFLLELQAYTDKGKVHALILAAAFTALACMTRYIGITIMPVAGIVLLIQNKKISKRIADIMLYGTISSLTLVCWIIRNYLVSGTLLGSRTPSSSSLGQNIAYTLGTFITWVFPGVKLALKQYLELWPLLAFTAVIFAAVLIKSIRDICKNMSESSWKLKLATCPAVPPFCFAAAYTAYLIASATKVAFDPIGTRLLSPAYVPLVFFMVWAAGVLYEGKSQTTRRKTAALLATAIGFIWLLLPLSTALKTVRESLHNGVGGFNSTVWHKSAHIDFLKQNTLDGQVYSNQPDAIYILTGIKARYIPRKNNLAQYGMEPFKSEVAKSGKSYIVWFDSNPIKSLYSIDELKQIFNIRFIKKTKDGNIYSISTAE